MDVRLPDGTIVKNVPDGTTKADLVTKLQANGMSVPSEWLPAAPSGPAPSGILKGLNDVAAGGGQLLAHMLPDSVVSVVNKATKFVNEFPVIGPVTQAIGMVPATPEELDQQIADTGKRYTDARKASGATGIDWGRGAGQAIGTAPLAAFLPAAGPTLAGRAVAGASAGAAGGALQPVEDQGGYAGDKAAQIGLGAATGAVLAPALGAVADKVVNGVKSFFANRQPISLEQIDSVIRQNLQSAGQRWEDLGPAMQSQLREQAVTALQTSKRGLDHQALIRQQDFAAEGMRPTLGQITRDAAQFAKEKNLRTMPGVGDPLLERFQGQGTQLQQKLGAFAKGATGDKTLAGEQLAGALKNYDSQQSQAVASAYKAARESAGKDAEVPLQGLAQEVADIFDRYRTAVPSGIRGQFSKYGLDPSEVVNQRKLFTVEEADKLLKEINKQGGTEPAVQSALGELRAAVKKAVVTDAGVDDVFAPARKLAAERFGLHEAVPALEAAAKGTTAPDDFVRRFIISGKTREVEALAGVLRKSSPEAMDQARAQVGAYLQRKAFGTDVVGDAPFNPKQYAEALREFGDTKLGALFTPAEVNQLHRLGRIGAYINQIPNASPVQHSNNWGAITNLATKIPGVPMVVGATKAAGNAVGNQMAVSRALTANVPQQPTQLNPEAAKALARLLSAGSFAGGAGIANQVNQ
jgi:hypothetical protein